MGGNPGGVMATSIQWGSKRAGWSWSPVAREQLAKDHLHLFYALNQRVHVAFAGVDVEGGPAERGDVEVLHQGLAAVMAGANSYAFRVEDAGRVVGVYALYGEGDHAALALRIGTVDGHTRESIDSFQ